MFLSRPAKPLVEVRDRQEARGQHVIVISQETGYDLAWLRVRARYRLQRKPELPRNQTSDFFSSPSALL
jgi:hypothetical protein